MAVSDPNTGASEPFGWGLKSITFSGGQRVEVPTSALFIIVGPNNSGKSQALRELRHGAQTGQPQGPVLTDVEIYQSGDTESFRSWLAENYQVGIRDGAKVFFTAQAHIFDRNVEAEWGASTHPPSTMEFLVHYLDTANRLHITQDAGAFNPANQDPAHYFHQLILDPDLEASVSSLVEQAFGESLVLQRLGPIKMHIGEEPRRNKNRDRTSTAYQSELLKVPGVFDQGDGIKSFIGTLLASKCGAHPVLLIDEPEAFLHPPQARRLAMELATSAKDKSRQVIIATHSSDVVLGAIESGVPITICRITRDPGGSSNAVSVLDADQLTEMASDPLLRSAAAIEGVFHEGVVVSEGPSDSRVYESALRIRKSADGNRIPDLKFTDGGGKGSLAKLISAYTALSTPIVAIADFDLLQKEGELKAVLDSLGANFDDIETDYRVMCDAIDGRRELTTRQFLNKMKGVLDSIPKDNPVTGTARRDLQDLISSTRDWSEAQRYGVDRLKGDPRKAANKVLEWCSERGLFLVDVGTLEGWWPTGPRDKGEWFTGAITRMHTTPDEFEALFDFMDRVAAPFTDREPTRRHLASPAGGA